MKNILKIIVSFAILGGLLYFAYQNQDAIRSRLAPATHKIALMLGVRSAPCEEPITYTLGTFDPKFNISKSYFLDALREAEMIWEKPFGKELFVYEEGAKGDALKVNLVYDYRQDATNKLASLGIVVKENRASYDELRRKFTALKAEFAAAKISYDARVQSFNAKQKAYEEQVEYWNTQGGAPKKEYDELEAERSALNSEATELQALQGKINKMVDEINALVVVLNRLANTLNITVDKYNTIGASRGESFTEGVYSSDGKNREIDIYEFSNRTKLVRVLAHELGHALDLDHVNDTKAIMYSLNQGTSGALTQTDLDALKARCEVE